MSGDTISHDYARNRARTQRLETATEAQRQAIERNARRDTTTATTTTAG
ncbi:hypothetical protein JNW90_24245 [Micromonospora sp. STR1s_5]|nr:hypothetical protein [Micromonospora sp. STR1s_5]